MEESKILKGRCKKTGAQFGMELKSYGGEWKVVNMIKMTDAEADGIRSEVRQPRFVTHTNLIPCQKCGSRVVGGCACAKAGAVCTKEMKYKFACLYCNEFEINYSTKITPYTKWAGISNIPGATKDKFGNPSGSDYDLAQDGAFEGYTVIILGLGASSRKYNLSDPKAALEKKGFTVLEYRKVPPIEEFKRELSKDKTQLWILADKETCLSEQYYSAIQTYFENGNGVYFWSEEEPYFQDVNPMLIRLFGASMYGNSRGGKVLGVQAEEGQAGIVANHPITTGIVSFYEGTTISTVELGTKLKPLVYGSNKKIATAYYDDKQRRAIVDGGYTRLYCQWDSAGTDRYVVNAAAWLTNIERFGY